MVLTQPVVYELGRLRPPTLLIVGERDTTAIGKQCKQHPVFFITFLRTNPPPLYSRYASSLVF